MSKLKAISEIRADNFDDWSMDVRLDGVYSVEDNLYVTMNRSYTGDGDGRLYLKGLDNAMKRGETVTDYSLEDTGESLWINLMVEAGIESMRDLYDRCEELEFSGYGSVEMEIAGTTVEVWKSEEKAIRRFSPLHLHNLKPLNGEPKKWNVRLATRAILNGQFERLECTGKYSDDYARDAAYNFHKGEISNHIAWVKDVIERPGGWRTYAEEEEDGKTVVHLCCHHFNNNLFIFNEAVPDSHALEEA